MTEGEATGLVAKLFAAFPFPQQEMTAAVYVEQMAALPNRDYALEAVNALIRSSSRLPAVVELLEEYERARESAQERTLALELPEMPQEEIAANMARLKVMEDAIATKQDIDEAMARTFEPGWRLA